MKNKDVKVGVPVVVCSFSTYLNQYMSPSKYLMPLAEPEKLGVLADHFTRYANKPPSFAVPSLYRAYTVPLDQKNYYERTDYFVRCQLLNPDLTPMEGTAWSDVLVPCRKIDLTHAQWVEIDAKQKEQDTAKATAEAIRNGKAEIVLEQIKTMYSADIAHASLNKYNGVITIKFK